jgi:hypothetical protein
LRLSTNAGSTLPALFLAWATFTTGAKLVIDDEFDQRNSSPRCCYIDGFHCPVRRQSALDFTSPANSKGWFLGLFPLPLFPDSM